MKIEYDVIKELFPINAETMIYLYFCNSKKEIILDKYNREKIAEELNIKENTVFKSLKKLTEKGLLRKERRMVYVRNR